MITLMIFISIRLIHKISLFFKHNINKKQNVLDLKYVKDKEKHMFLIKSNNY